jgi:carbonic anhydrase
MMKKPKLNTDIQVTMILWKNVSVINVKQTGHAIIERNPILKEMIESGEIAIIGGTRNISKGEVSFYEDTALIIDTINR